jgi:hypothetical protein
VSAEINECYKEIMAKIHTHHNDIKQVQKRESSDFFKALESALIRIIDLHHKAMKAHEPVVQKPSDLERERDWFRREALKLNQLVKDRDQEVLRLKAEARQL